MWSKLVTDISITVASIFLIHNIYIGIIYLTNMSMTQNQDNDENYTNQAYSGLENHETTFLTDLIDKQTIALQQSQQSGDNIDLDKIQFHVTDFFEKYQLLPNNKSQTQRSNYKTAFRFPTPTQSGDDLDLHLYSDCQYDQNKNIMPWLSTFTLNCNNKLEAIDFLEHIANGSIPFGEVAATAVLEQWQAQKKNRKQEIQKVINEIQYLVTHKDEIRDTEESTPNIFAGDTSAVTFVKCIPANNLNHNGKKLQDLWTMFSLEQYGTVNIKTKLPCDQCNKFRILKICVKATVNEQFKNIGYQSIFDSENKNATVLPVYSNDNNPNCQKLSDLKFQCFVTNNKTNRYRNVLDDNHIANINIKNGSKTFDYNETDNKQSVLASDTNYIWKSMSGVSSTKIAINDLDAYFSTSRNYHISIVNCSNMNGHIKVQIICDTELKRNSMISKSSKKSKSALSRNSKAIVTSSYKIRSNLNRKIRQIKKNQSCRMDFEATVAKLKENRIQTDQVVNKQDIVTQNTKVAGDLVWNSPRFISMFKKLTRKSPYCMVNAQQMQAHVDNIPKWTQWEDSKLEQLADRFHDLPASRKWLLISQMINHMHLGKTGSDNEKGQLKMDMKLCERTPMECNQRHAILVGYKQFENKKSGILAAQTRKSDLETQFILENQQKLTNFWSKLQQIENRKQYILFQQKNIPVQKRWIIILEYFKRFELIVTKLHSMKQKEREIKAQLHAALILQRWAKQQLAQKRKLRAACRVNYFKAIINICVLNHKMNQYNRASNILKTFFATSINIYSNDMISGHNGMSVANYNPVSRIINSFRNTISVLQRFVQRVNARRNAQCVLFAIQLIAYITNNQNILQKLNLQPKNDQQFQLDTHNPVIHQVCLEIFSNKQHDYKMALRSYHQQIQQFIKRKYQTNKHAHLTHSKIIASQIVKYHDAPIRPRYSVILEKNYLDTMVQALIQKVYH